MKIYNKILSLLMFAVIFTTTLSNTACPVKSTITKAIHAAEKIDVVTTTAVQTTKLAFNEGLLTFEQKESLLPKMNLLAKGSLAFQEAAKKFKAEGEITQSKWQILAAMLDANIVAPFLEILAELKVIKNASKILAALGVVQVTVIAILQAFEKEKAISMINLHFRELTNA